MSWLALPRFTRSEILFSLKSFGAAMLALYLASRAGLPRPFWALLTTYVVAQPLAGTVRSKGLFRFAGTLIGSTATVLLVPALSNAPELLVLALALWVGLCLYLSLQDRSAQAYVFMLAGYTAALIGFPSVETPQLVFETAVTRVEEIGLGIFCATVVHSLVLPASLAPSLLGLVDRTLGDARRWFGDLLTPNRPADSVQQNLLADRQRLAVDLTQLRLLSTHVPFDTGHVRWTAGAVGAMQDAGAALTPVLSAVEDRLQALVDHEGALAPEVADVLARTSDWLEAELAGRADSPQMLAALRGMLHSLGQAAPPEPAAPDASWRRAMRIGLAVRLEELIDAWRRCLALRQAIDDGLSGAAPRGQAAGFSHRVLHRDVGMALLSALAAVLAICLCGAFWIATAWPSGSVATMMAAVFCCFFATLDDPVPAINSFLKFTLWSLPLSAVYVLLLPSIQDYGMLVALCAPTLLLLGCLVARPATMGPAMAMVMGFGGTLALHDTASADMVSFINSNLAQLLGIAAAALVTKLVRSVGADWSARRIQRAVWRELGEIAAAPGAQPRHESYAVRMVDRISLLAPRIAQAEASVRDATADATLRDLRVGADIVALQRVRAVLQPDAASALLRGVSRLFRERRAEPGSAGRRALRVQLDDLLAGIFAGGPGPSADRRGAVAALVGLRRDLFPGAPGTLSTLETQGQP